MSDIYDPAYRVFTECLKSLRKRSRMTQQELATALGCGQAYISKYESGQKRLDIIEIRNVCRVLGFTLTEFAIEYEERLKEEGL